jgi:DNA-binding CsgD family transcriptional regulator
VTALRPDVFGQRLTRSEHALLLMLANGRTATEVMAELGLTRHTINSHRDSTYRKLGVHSLHDAVLAAVKARIIAPSDIVTGPMVWIPQLAEAQAAVAALQAQADGMLRRVEAAEEDRRRLRGLLGRAEDELAVHRQRAAGRPVETRQLAEAGGQL